MVLHLDTPIALNGPPPLGATVGAAAAAAVLV
eukprot:CAMPEP_0198356730 /NCGR_PEP_ID=MMETSP1450-20131203/123970_1 /TAXON_ID=753684 ORGANISM="Madagascaria erythrocladiodes, Strain CCMP3234" /NCGR_SAMPLE_ID=MMETSP1450 /ASSEMBLY_ACC=CAM_ASM_001115 /LENGTH=31 /DNA_ID= /DNA_START= /DNA_END= /DNA_ORIENTATION=